MAKAKKAKQKPAEQDFPQELLQQQATPHPATPLAVLPEQQLPPEPQLSPEPQQSTDSKTDVYEAGEDDGMMHMGTGATTNGRGTQQSAAWSTAATGGWSSGPTPAPATATPVRQQAQHPKQAEMTRSAWNQQKTSKTNPAWGSWGRQEVHGGGNYGWGSTIEEEDEEEEEEEDEGGYQQDGWGHHTSSNAWDTNTTAGGWGSQTNPTGWDTRTPAAANAWGSGGTTPGAWKTAAAPNAGWRSWGEEAKRMSRSSIPQAGGNRTSISSQQRSQIYNAFPGFGGQSTQAQAQVPDQRQYVDTLAQLLSNQPQHNAPQTQQQPDKKSRKKQKDHKSSGHHRSQSEGAGAGGWGGGDDGWGKGNSDGWGKGDPAGGWGNGDSGGWGRGESGGWGNGESGGLGRGDSGGWEKGDSGGWGKGDSGGWGKGDSGGWGKGDSGGWGKGDSGGWGKGDSGGWGKTDAGWGNSSGNADGGGRGGKSRGHDSDWGAIEEEEYGDDDRRVRFSPSASGWASVSSRQTSLWAKEKHKDTPYTMPSKTLAHAYNGTSTSLHTSLPRNKLSEYTNIDFQDSGGAGLAPVEHALFGRARKAKDRLHWMFPSDKDGRVDSVINWIQTVSYDLATYGLHMFLQTQERGALFTNAAFRLPGQAEPAFDWLTFDQLQNTRDKIIQESVAMYDPMTQVIVFVFLPSPSGSSVAIWRRRIKVPNNIRLMLQAEINQTMAGLRREEDYLVHVDEIPTDSPSRRASGGGALYSAAEVKKPKKKRWWRFW